MKKSVNLNCARSCLTIPPPHPLPAHTPADSDEKVKTKRSVYDELNVQRDMAEGDAAAMTTEEQQVAQAHILRAMYLSFFRVLKGMTAEAQQARKGPRHMLPAVLDGLHRFTHLISVDFLADLFGVLSTLLRAHNSTMAAGDEARNGMRDDDEKDGDYEFATTDAEQRAVDAKRAETNVVLSVEVAFKVVSTVLELLSGRGAALTVDSKAAYTALYFLMPKITAADMDHVVPTACKCLELAVLRKKGLQLQIVAALLKQAMTVASILSPHSSMQLMHFCWHTLQRYPRARALLDGDQESRGVLASAGALGAVEYDASKPPEFCNALSTTSWELVPMQSHFHPFLATVSTSVAQVDEASLQPPKFALAESADLRHAYNATRGGFNPPIPVRFRALAPLLPAAAAAPLLRAAVLAIDDCCSLQS